MSLFGETVTVRSAIFLVLALLLALSFEFVSGFHDTSNAVATVIYTHSLKATYAVVWSGMWNLIGVLTADNLGLPVSTTHIRSSGVAGSMWAKRSGLQGDTVRSILLAWVLTLPVCVLLGSALFAASFYLLFHIFGVK